MQRFASSLAVVAILSAVVAVSLIGGPQVSPVSAKPNEPAASPTANLQIKIEDRNPWTNLQLNNKSENFQFVIVSDRTGGHRPGVFAKAVEKINLLQPEFVVSVGDLIEGYTEDNTQWALEWAEFQGKLNRLQMPFFYVPGNHDLANPKMDANWKRKFGRGYYEFVYHDTLFVALNTEDPPTSEKEMPFKFGVEQQKWLEDVLAKNANVRWTFFLMHKPAWTYPDDDHAKTGWGRIEQIMGNRNYTVFAGHKHNYARYVRNGRDYIMLATTGGASKLRGTADGEFDHVVWVTMKDNNPVLANLMLDGIADKDIRTLPEPKPSVKKVLAK
ncbi:MAG: metallophosphoesterase [Planctomycetales bacterium]|nr:metallophosphoesterase [Planctomycetales bacterium]